MHTVSWVVKASKLCNLRCRYCYEWDELSDPRRIPLERWEKLLVEMRAYARLQSARLARPVATRLVWHGGEPLLLPSAYLRSVLELEREVFGPESVESGTLTNSLQTNLVALSDEKVELLREGRFALGVSMDVVGGVRLSLSGRETELEVADNIDRLRAAGIPFGAIAVLARHTLPHLRRLHDFYEYLGVSYRVLPLFPAPRNTPDAPFAVGTDEMVEGLNDLFAYWFENGCRIAVDPLSEYLQTVLLKMTSLSRSPWSRRTHGDDVFIVNTDGGLFHVLDAYDDERKLGNVFTEAIEEILASPAATASLDRTEALVKRHCGPCPHLGPCTTAPLHESRLAHPAAGRCAIAYPVQAFIERYLDDQGVTAEDVKGLLPEVAAERFVV